MPAQLKSIRSKFALLFILAMLAFAAVEVIDTLADARTADHVRAEYVRLLHRQHNPAALEEAMAALSAAADAELARDKVNLIVSLGVGLTAVLAAYAAANRTAHSISRLSRAAKSLAVGDYRRRITVGSSQELQSLADSFNALGESLIRHEATQREQAHMLAGMVEAARVTSASLKIEECGKAIARAVCTYLGASQALVFRKDSLEGGVRIIGRCGERRRADWKRLAAHSSDSGEYLVLSEAERDGENEREALLVAAPLTTNAGTLGAVVARFADGFSRSDLQLGSLRSDVLRAFAVHAAAAVANAETYGRTERYSEALEGWVDHVSAVMHVTEAISSSLNLEEALAALAKATATVTGADECVIYLPEDGMLVVKSCFCEQERKHRLADIKLAPGQSITGMAFERKECIACYDGASSDDKTTRERCAPDGLRGILAAPLLVGDETIGVISLYCYAARVFTDKEKQLLTSIALHAAIVVHNAKLYTAEATIAEALQRSLTSRAPERCKGLAFSGKYMPALDEASVGGDFFDVIPLPNGKVAVVIGDVSGKGLDAAIHLAACKYMLKSLIYTHPDDPAGVLAQLNDAMGYYFQQEFFVTAFLAVIDPDTRDISYASAGHPPAFLIAQQGQMHTRLSSTGLPLGCGRACRYGLETLTADTEDVLLLYTDGVTDAVKDGFRLEIEGLHRLVFEAAEMTGARIVESISEALDQDSDSRRKDDIALLAVSFGGEEAAVRVTRDEPLGEQHSLVGRNG